MRRGYGIAYIDGYLNEEVKLWQVLKLYIWGERKLLHIYREYYKYHSFRLKVI